METNKNYVFTQKHDELALSIFSSANCSNIFEQDENQATECIGLWDTGANNTCISNRLASKLGLIEIDFMRIATASGIVRVPMYLIDLILPNGYSFKKLYVAEFTYTDDDCDLIIGMDIIRVRLQFDVN